MCVAVYFDARKAFNSVDRNILLNKMMDEYQFDPCYVNMFSNYLSNCSIRIKGKTKLYPNQTGVAQGAALGPLLYTMFINSVSNIINVPHLLYADDLVIYLGGDSLADIVDRLQNVTNSIEQWCKDHNVMLNADKTFWQVFHKPKHNLHIGNDVTLKLNGQNIERVKVFKYLGVEIDSNLSFMQQFDKVSKKVSSGLGYMYSIKRNLTEHVMKMLLCSYVLSYIEYCTEIWLVQTDLTILPLQKKLDRFLVAYYYPSLVKKKGDINVSPLWDKLAIMFVKEKYELTLLNGAFQLFKGKGSDSEDIGKDNDKDKDAVISKFILPKHKSELYKKNDLQYRQMLAWNLLPRSMSANSTGPMFNFLCTQILMNRRKSKVDPL